MRTIGLSIVFVLLISACTKTEKERYYTQEEVQRITDSARLANIKLATAAAQKDLEIRKAIELKSRMDSIKKGEKRK